MKFNTIAQDWEIYQRDNGIDTAEQKVQMFAKDVFYAGHAHMFGKFQAAVKTPFSEKLVELFLDTRKEISGWVKNNTEDSN